MSTKTPPGTRVLVVGAGAPGFAGTAMAAAALQEALQRRGIDAVIASNAKLLAETEHLELPRLLDATITTPDPKRLRIRLVDGSPCAPYGTRYLCVGYGAYGHGETPARAYEDWRISEKSLRAFHHCKPIHRPPARAPRAKP